MKTFSTITPETIVSIWVPKIFYRFYRLLCRHSGLHVFHLLCVRHLHLHPHPHRNKLVLSSPFQNLIAFWVRGESHGEVPAHGLQDLPGASEAPLQAGLHRHLVSTPDSITQHVFYRHWTKKRKGHREGGERGKSVTDIAVHYLDTQVSAYQTTWLNP